MIIKEGEPQLELDLPDMNTDQTFTCWNPKLKKYEKAHWIEKTGLSPHHFLYAIIGAPSSGKTSILTSMLCAKGEKSRLYRGCFDTIYVCASETSMRSIKGDPFGSIDSSQFYEEFNDEFLIEMKQKVEEHSEKGEDTLIVIDDACNRLKSMSNEFCNLLMVFRHLRFSCIILCQCPIMLSIQLRSNLSGVFLFKQSNKKRSDLIYEEYVSQLTKEEYKKFEKWVWRKKGDVLFISFKLPHRYWRNFKELTFENLTNETKITLPQE